MEFDRCYGCMQPLEGEICPHCGWEQSRSSDRHQLPPGALLQEKYLVGRVLGQGGFGITYLGWDLLLDMPIAIKEFYPRTVVNRDHTLSTEVRVNTASMEERYQHSMNRFLREAQALGKLRHVPQIVDVHNCFRENGTAYIVMEFVPGRELKDYVAFRGGSLGVQECLRLLKPVAEALAAVHSKGFVHRDISPDNIMLHPMGGAKLLDFGAVRAVENPQAGQNLSESTEAVVKHGFAPPEQYQNRGGIGPWTDEYAFCATIYYCLTGCLPPEAMSRFLYGEEPDWAAIDGLTEGQLAALKKGMSLRAEDRYGDMRALTRDLYEEQAVPAAPPAVTITPPAQDNETPPGIPQETVPPAPPVKKEEKPEKSTRRSLWPVAAGAVLAAAAALAAVLLIPGNPVEELPTEPPQLVSEISDSQEQPGTQTLPESSPEEPTQTEPPVEESAEPEPWRENVLMPGYIELLWDENSFDQQIVFLDTVKNAPERAIDVTVTSDENYYGPACTGKVLMWRDEGTTYVAAEGGVNGREALPGMFQGLKNLAQIQFNGALHTEEAVSMEGMFSGCTRLETVDAQNLDTSNITNMAFAFANCSRFQSLDLSGWDTSNVTNMSYMFSENERLQFLDLSGWDTGKVTDMKSMFSGCRELTRVECGGFDTSQVTNLFGMFYDCRSLESVDVAAWDVSQVEYMTALFQNCTSLKKVDVSRWDTGNVIRFDNMFGNCYSLRELAVENFDTARGENFSLMFGMCTGLETLPVSGWDVSNATGWSEFWVYGNIMDNGQPWTELFKK